MKFVLFLIFAETSVLPLADYETLAECQAVQQELEETQVKPDFTKTDLTDLMENLSMAVATYQCFAVPDTYDW